MTIFITGTDTNVGKTIVAAGLAAVMQGLGYSMSVYKPVQTGSIPAGENLISPDLHFVNSIDTNILTKSTYEFIDPVAPSVAAQNAGIKINTGNFTRDYAELKQKSDFVIVEGAGGLLTPIYENFLMRDLITLLSIPVIIVAKPDLGTINHTLLTIEAAKASGLNIKGIIISNYPFDTDDIAIRTAPKTIESLCDVEILGVLPHINGLMQDYNNSDLLLGEVLNHIDIQRIFNLKIPKLL